MCTLSWHYLVLLGLWQLFEHWLGCTDKVKAGSTSALIFNAVESIVMWIVNKLN